MLDIVRAFKGQPARTAAEWACVLSELLEKRFRDRHGQVRSRRAKATIVGLLFTEYLDGRFEVDGEGWRLAREWPEGVGRPAVWGIGGSKA